MLDAIVAILIIGGFIIGVFAVVSIWETRDKRRLLHLGMDASGIDHDPDNAYWGNNCLLLLYMGEFVAVATIQGMAQVIPVASILECSSTMGAVNGGISRLTMHLNDPTNPEVSLAFPDTQAGHAQAAISSLMSMLVREVDTLPEIVMEEPDEDEGDMLPFTNSQVIDSTPRDNAIIINDMRPAGHEKGERVVINEFTRPKD